MTIKETRTRPSLGGFRLFFLLLFVMAVALVHGAAK